VNELVARIGDERIDTLPVERAELADLDLDAVAHHITRATENDRYDGGTHDPLDFLREMRCVVESDGRLIPTLAGLLIFGRRPQSFIEHTDIALAHFAGTRPDLVTETLHFRRYGGTLTQQIDEVEKYLWSNTRRSISTDSGPQREERPDYPRKALRELTANAVTHRDYNLLGARTQISMFTDRIEWRSPGGLPPGITEDNILYSGSRARNPTIAQLLYQSGYIEAFGMGLPTVINLLKLNDLPPLGMRDTGASFIVTMRGPEAPNVATLTPPRRALLELARKYREITLEQAIRASSDRARRTVQADLKYLVEHHFLRAVGQSRDRRYIIAEETEW
jgi:predicted HTH transcriptional regulator